MSGGRRKTTRNTSRKQCTPMHLKLPALAITQGRGRHVYAFGVDGKQLATFASVSRISRGDDQDLHGYQRPEVLSHIAQIRKYLESDRPMLPNAIVVAFGKEVSFTPAVASHGQDTRSGILTIPLRAPNESPSGWIVDGQQRTAAIRDARVKSFPVFVIGFIADGETEQREQFLLVNSTKPLPKGLLYELLPAIESPVPEALERRRLPVQLLQALNHDPASPFCGLISTPTAPTGVVKDNSVLRMLENSLSDGALFQLRDPLRGEGDFDGMIRVLCDYWEAVKKTFPDAWGVPPKKSRLMHGAGIISMGFLMDAITDRLGPSKRRIGVARLATELAVVAPLCKWTHGFWRFAEETQVKWNELQNTTHHIQLLSNYLLAKYHRSTRQR
jgi:DGQHR domain-containing protein